MGTMAGWLSWRMVKCGDKVVGTTLAGDSGNGAPDNSPNIDGKSDRLRPKGRYPHLIRWPDPPCCGQNYGWDGTYCLDGGW